MSELLLISGSKSKGIDFSSLRVNFYGVSQDQRTGTNTGPHYHLMFIELFDSLGRLIPNEGLIASASSSFNANTPGSALEVSDQSHWVSGVVNTSQWDTGNTWWQVDGPRLDVAKLRLVWVSYCAPKVRVSIDGQVHRLIESIAFPNELYHGPSEWAQLYQYDISL